MGGMNGDQASYDAIVIGAGVGGCVAAAVLASEGLSVLVLEKNGRIGGVCATYDRDGFKVDVGTHMFSRGRQGPLGALARRVGAPPIPFVQTRDLVVVKGFGQTLRVPRDPHRFPAFIVAAIRALKLRPAEVLEAGRFFRAVLTFDEAVLPGVDRLTMWEFITGYTKNPRLIGLFGFLLGLYFILPLQELSAGEGIWCFRRMFRDRALAYPKGGAVTVPEAFLSAARQRGATVHTRREATRISIEAGAVVGVECGDGSLYESPVVIGTTSLKDHVDRLVGEQHLPDAYVRRVQGLKSSMIAVQAKIALRRPLVDAGCLVGVSGGVSGGVLDGRQISLDDLDRLYDDVRKGRVTRITPIYAPVPTNFDPTLAPDGAQLITACAVAPTGDIELVDGSQRWIDNMMDALRNLIPGLDKELMWVDTRSVASIGRWSGKVHSPAVSTGQVPDQVGNRRPPVHTPIRGLYVAGCGAGARGVGTELAATSGAEAADRAVQDRTNGLL